MEKINKNGWEDNEQEDVNSFGSVLADKFNIFLERREQYGNHLENARRFPLEDQCGLYLKCCRIIRDIESGHPIKKDTLLDLSNYADLILSAMENTCK